ncbi:aldo/keto reductase [Colletotrichum higginsianum]|uniref:Aldo/keto reductase n=2 Tax=Colletotrichum higginsianum TaxID=80884 RepID=H1VLR9_COLHI|nr:Aldo/keto reductase [Colletotrichum higginsianum IMI 349063]OBR04989.1 Aldo/keto reductase [Colletotrichum higginsianum IMI 349063]TIC93596.1 Pyridoxal reductase [Colletotrichum higginsianum]CCF41172.1 aldo/keto reductase [Colletotrichum higginsianum]
MPQLNGQEVGNIGYGLMGLTWRPQPCSEEQAFEAMRAALKNGNNFWNGGEFYGTPEYNSSVLLERYFAKFPEDADKVVLSMKGGVNLKNLHPDGSPEGVRRSLDNIINQLKGRKKVDMFECARRDKNTPLEVTFGVIQKEYIDTGKVGGICLSEVSAATIHEAVKHAKIVGVEVELSLFSTEILTNGVAAACAQYGIPIIAYSPVGRGMLTGQVKTLDDIPHDDMRRHMPRFQPDTFGINIKLVEQVETLARKKGVTPAQLAIGWTVALSRRPGIPMIIPIPGATTADRVNENAKLVELTDEEMAEIDATLAKFEVVGGRYPEGAPVNT